MISFLEKCSLTKNKLLIPFNVSGKNIGTQFKVFCLNNLMSHGLAGLIRHEFVRSYNQYKQTKTENFIAL